MMEELAIIKVIDRLLKLPKECEWVEFKSNFNGENDIGKYISALSNGAYLQNEPYGYLVFGVDDVSLTVIGSKFKPKQHKVGNEELENWLLQRTSPRVEVIIFEIIYREHSLAVFQIQAAIGQPTCFSNIDYVRVGSITRPLKDFPEKEKKIWINSSKKAFEKGIALIVSSASDIIRLLDTQCYFDLLKISYPTTQEAVVEKFMKEKFVQANSSGYAITNLGALLFAKDIQEFDTVKRKAVRVIQYLGKDKIRTVKEYEGKFGYAVGFEGMVQYINDLLPNNEIIGKALRDTVRMYPEIAVRELVANSMIHQDFEITGTGPMVEIFDDRIEITNPGLPLITLDHFIDECQSRNEDLASIMRRFRICEERGSGMDKVVFDIELFQLPAYNALLQEKHTKVILYAFRKFSDMDKLDRIRACYQHACLKYVMNEKMSNTSLRERFKISDENSAMVSRVIRDTLQAGLVKEENPGSKSRKFAKYIPIWA